MQLGISTYSLPWFVGVPGYMPATPLAAIELLYLAQANGIHRVQYGDNLPLHELSTPELKELKAFAAAHAIVIETGTQGLLEDHTREYLQIARFLESPFLRVVIDQEDFHPEADKVIETIHSLLPYIRETGIPMGIENHDRFPALSLERIINETDPQWVGVCLDTANSIGAGEGIATVVRVLAPYTLNLHIKDISIERVSHKMGFTVKGCAAGKGVLDIPRIIREVAKHGRCTSATLEIWSDLKEDLEATLQQEKEWFDESINYLKNILT